jgi:hypothetical protein
MQGDGGSSIRVCPLDNDLTTVNNKDDVDGLECEIPSPLYYIELEKEAPIGRWTPHARRGIN